jgi:phospholipid transport system substrate-binding protein
VTEAYGCSARYGRRLPALVVAAVILTLGGVRALAEEAGTDGTPKTVVDAQGPLDLVQSSVWLVFSIVRSQPDSEQRRMEIHHVGEALFDFNEIARRTLAQHWSARSLEEQRTFVRLFTNLLERTYVTTMGNNRLATVTFQGETIEGSSARVQSRLVTHRGAEIPLEYRLLERAGRWAVYDVVVDGVSQVASYRSQFNSILRTSSFDLFLDKLRNEARLTPAGGEAP